MNLKFPDKFTVEKGRKGDKGLKTFSFSLFLCGSILSAASAQSADETVRAVNAAEAKTAYSATQIVQRGGSREVARIYRNGVKRRVEWLEPGIRRGDFLLDDGQNVWLYHRADNSAIRTKSSGRGRTLPLQGWKLGSGGGANRVVLTRENGRSLSVDARTRVILATRSAGQSTSLKDVDYGAVPAVKFVFSKPAGAEVTKIEGTLFGSLNGARRQASWLKVPTQMPAGYKLESAVVGQNEAWLRYSNNRKRFSIFQQKADAGEIKPQSVNGGWFWKSDNLRFMVTGAPEEAIEKMAASLK